MLLEIQPKKTARQIDRNQRELKAPMVAVKPTRVNPMTPETSRMMKT